MLFYIYFFVFSYKIIIYFKYIIFKTNEVYLYIFILNLSFVIKENINMFCNITFFPNLKSLLKLQYFLIYLYMHNNKLNLQFLCTIHFLEHRDPQQLPKWPFFPRSFQIQEPEVNFGILSENKIDFVTAGFYQDNWRPGNYSGVLAFAEATRFRTA